MKDVQTLNQNMVIPPKNIVNKNSVIADPDYSGHYDGTKNFKSKPVLNEIIVLLPNGGHMTSTHIRSLNIPTLPPNACIQHMFPEMKTTGLVSIGQLCDHGCTATFSKKKTGYQKKRMTLSSS